MRIGIDLDDTICRTTEIVHDRLAIHASSKNSETFSFQFSAMQQFQELCRGI